MMSENRTSVWGRRDHGKRWEEEQYKKRDG